MTHQDYIQKALNELRHRTGGLNICKLYGDFYAADRRIIYHTLTRKSDKVVSLNKLQRQFWHVLKVEGDSLDIKTNDFEQKANEILGAV